MSKISTLHDAIVTKISTNLSSYTQIPNPYLIEEAPQTLLKKGFAVSIGPGTRTDRLLGCEVSWQRTFTITLINFVNARDNDTTSRETLIKNFLEDHYTLLTKFEIDGGLSGTAIDGIVTQDSGVEYIEIDTKPFILTEIELSVEYIEDLTAV